MELHEGQKLAHYRLTEPLGKGGMGEVWKAVDTTLSREVAVKLLPSDLATDPDRLARFEREAKVLASLNHPGIAQIYGFHREGRNNETCFLAMELIAGEDLGARLERGAVPVEEALEIARQVAEALEEAHEHHVVHRDLKPANIVLSDDGNAKVLDFGLAKVQAGRMGSSAGDLSLSPTVTSLGTEAGIILGTAAYMSPEQARGKAFDRRTDIWSFGCVLYEALTGRHLFRGETVSDTIALILRSRPAWDALPSTTPVRVRELLERCLVREPRGRLRDIGEARVMLESALDEREWEAPPDTRQGGAAPSPSRGRLLPAALLVGGLLAGALGWAWLAPSPPARSGPLHVSIEAPTEYLPEDFTLTPDGRALLFTGNPRQTGAAVRSRLFVRPLDRVEATPIVGTEGANDFAVSPDGRWLAFPVQEAPGSPRWQLQKIPLDGSTPPLVLADWGENWAPASPLWISDERLVVTRRDPNALIWIAADGSGIQETIPLDLGETIPELRLHDALPDGIHALASSYSWDGGYHDQTYVVNTKTGTSRKLLEVASFPEWSPSGHLVFSRDETLMAVPFDPGSLEVRGGPVALMDGLGTGAGEAGGYFDIAGGGELIYQSGGRVGSSRRIIQFDDQGGAAPWSTDRLPFVGQISISPDGRHLATTVMKQSDLLYSVWISELDRPRLRQLAAMERLDCNEARWHPDGRLMFHCEGDTEEAGFYIASLDQSEPPRRVWQSGVIDPFFNLTQVHPDGRHFVVEGPGPEGHRVTWLVLLDGSGEAQELLGESARASAVRFSPDGRCVAYISVASGRPEVLVAPIAGDGTVGASALAATTRATWVWWQPTGREGVFRLVYGYTLAQPLDSVQVSTHPVSITDPERWRDLSALQPRLEDLTMDPAGNLFAVQQDEQDGGNRRLDLVLGFEQELRRLVP